MTAASAKAESRRSRSIGRRRRRMTSAPMTTVSRSASRTGGGSGAAGGAVGGVVAGHGRRDRDRVITGDGRRVLPMAGAGSRAGGGGESGGRIHRGLRVAATPESHRGLLSLTWRLGPGSDITSDAGARDSPLVTLAWCQMNGDVPGGRAGFAGCLSHPWCAAVAWPRGSDSTGRNRRPRRSSPTLRSAVIEHEHGHLRVLAGPGTGKTSVIVAAVQHRIQRDSLSDRCSCSPTGGWPPVNCATD